ncbi:hypothetical protein PWT90_09311 [Aphanocladium album]|nr:hypothetical protein PWT90_09311 [Aphanocladium album]
MYSMDQDPYPPICSYLALQSIMLNPTAASLPQPNTPATLGGHDSPDLRSTTPGGQNGVRSSHGSPASKRGIFGHDKYRSHDFGLQGRKDIPPSAPAADSQVVKKAIIQAGYVQGKSACTCPRCSETFSHEASLKRHILCRRKFSFIM